MNERIKELLKQATKEVDPHDRVWVFSKVDQAKFAELIVLECDRYARSAWEHGELLGGDLKRHFGFEP